MKRKGFTLIELLAVIVILAVIALIATPIIMNVINDSKKGAAKDAMYGYVKAVELAGAKNVTPTTDAPTGNYITKDGNIYSGSTKVMDVSFKGTAPDDNGTITLNHGTVTNAELIFDGIKVNYDGKNVDIEDGSTPAVKAYSVGEVIYYNPETNKKCTSSEVNTEGNAKTGCLKWNVITTDDATNKTNINIMLDHNTTGKVAWNSSGNNKDGMKEVATALTSDVTTWNSSIKSTARLITGQEVANIGGDTAWNPGNYTETIYSNQSWLYQNLSGSNTDVKPNGYWTSTVYLSDSSSVWFVSYVGNLPRSAASNADDFGVRPVITILKSTIA